MKAKVEPGYASDLSDAQWAFVEPLLPRHGGCGGKGRPAKYPRRRMLEAMFYQMRTGCQWRLLPRGLPALEQCVGTLLVLARGRRVRARV